MFVQLPKMKKAKQDEYDNYISNYKISNDERDASLIKSILYHISSQYLHLITFIGKINLPHMAPMAKKQETRKHGYYLGAAEVVCDERVLNKM